MVGLLFCLNIVKFDYVRENNRKQKIQLTSNDVYTMKKRKYKEVLNGVNICL